jgi:polysaccharide biosynthesis protein PslH
MSSNVLGKLLRETESLPTNEPSGSTSHSQAVPDASRKAPAVIIVGPPWPRSGTARVMQSQVDYYRQRGLRTFFVVVPFHQMYMESKPIWNELNEGIQDLGADRIYIAALRSKNYQAAKYATSLRHAFRGTVLDWMIGVGRSARLPVDALQFFRDSTVALFHVNHVYTLGFALQLRHKLAGWGGEIPLVVDTHDVQSHVLQDKSEINPWTRNPDSLERMIRSEVSLLKKADVLVHLSVNDFEFFRARLPAKPHVLAMPTIDESFVSAVNASAPWPETIDLLFVGQSHRPNLEAMKWFFGEVWPLLAGRHYKLKVVGAVEMFVRQFLPDVYREFRPCFTGEVADLAPYYRAARCVIAPMVSGTGISIKTIEALALGKPFVGTSKSYRGMPLEKIREAGVHFHDEPQAFADAVAHALANEAEAAAISRTAYDRIFSTEAAFASRDEAIDIAMKKKLRANL